MKRSFTVLLAVVGPLALSSCNTDDFNLVTPVTNGSVSIQDQCDPATFNAALGAGTCTRQGTVTFAAFNAELTATRSVAAWRFVPTSLAISLGGVITATNQGGEVHTFTEVEQFGGGIVPALNAASGNPNVAPECLRLQASDRIGPGGSFRTDAETSRGTERYQCCIHPWMRTVVTVR